MPARQRVGRNIKPSIPSAQKQVDQPLPSPAYCDAKSDNRKASSPSCFNLDFCAINDALALDPRALALFRIGIGISILLHVLFEKWDEVGMFLTDESIIPRSHVLNEFYHKNGTLNYANFMLTTAPWSVYFGVGTAFGVKLLLSFQVRRFRRVCSWIRKAYFLCDHVTGSTSCICSTRAVD